MKQLFQAVTISFIFGIFLGAIAVTISFIFCIFLGAIAAAFGWLVTGVWLVICTYLLYLIWRDEGAFIKKDVDPNG